MKMKSITYWPVLLLLACSFSVLGQEIMETPNEIVATEQAEPEVQEVKYVTDKLRLSLYKRADSNSGNLKLLSSGDTLEVLGKSGPYSRVRTETGIIGWVKNGFLVSIPTASQLLVEELKKNEDLTRQLEKYADSRQMVKNYEDTISQMKTDFEDREQQLNQTRESLQQLSEDNAQLQQKLENLQQHSFELSDIVLLLKQFWYVVAVTVLAIFFIGLVLGREIIESRVRRKFQGVKVW